MSKILLLADDSVVVQKLVGLALAKEKFEIVTTDNGNDAVRKAREIRPDIVLADIVMPGKSGYEVCEFIKQDPALATIPVLLLTGTFEAPDEARALAVGADGLINKPFEAHVLVDRVHQLLEASSARFDRTRPKEPTREKTPGLPLDSTISNPTKTLETATNFRGIPKETTVTTPCQPYSSLIEVPESQFSESVTAAPTNTLTREFAPISLNDDLELETPAALKKTAGPPSESGPMIETRVQEAIEKIARKAFGELSQTIVEEVMVLVEEIAREVIPPLIEAHLREEIRNRKAAGD
ncbi:MAG: response regulator [Myxococcota bacterium]